MLFRGKIRCSLKYRVLTDTSPLVNYIKQLRLKDTSWLFPGKVQSAGLILANDTLVHKGSLGSIIGHEPYQKIAVSIGTS